MPRKIMLMSKFNQENFKLKDILAGHLKHDVYWVRTPQQAISNLTSQIKFEIVVINTDLFVKKKLDLVRHLRAVGCDSPVLFLADVIKDSQTIIPANLKTVVIDKPIHTSDLEGVIDRILERSAYAARYHKRFSTLETAKFELFRNGYRSPAVIRNLSLGGAFLQTDRTFQAGEMIKLWVQLDSLSKAHELSAKVVWNSEDPKHKGLHGIGVRFIRPGEVYESALTTFR